MAKAKTAKRKDEVAIGKGGGPYPLVPLPGARNIRTLSARFIADMQTHWEKHGMEALDEVREKFPEQIRRRQLCHAVTSKSLGS